jgi:DNA-binding HxlR family transcriptional regulator
MTVTTPSAAVDEVHPLWAVLHLVRHRTTLQILWVLQHGPTRSEDLVRRCHPASVSTLQARVEALRVAGLLVTANRRVALTPLGVALWQALRPVDEWSRQWHERRPPR